MTPGTDASPIAAPPSLIGNRQVQGALVGWIFIAVALVAHSSGASRSLVTVFYAMAIASASMTFAREAIEELWTEREIGIELLMTCAIASAATLGQWREAALVAALYSISEALEGFTIRRTRHAIRGLMDRVPPTARVRRNATDLEVPVAEIRVGDAIVVKPGESIATDGVIREGTSVIDESAVTGESMPVERSVGADVFAGTVNGNAVLLVEATRRYEDNTISRIIHLVEEAQKQKGASQVLVERFGRWYSPAVLGIAIIVAIAGVAMSEEPRTWLIKAASFLVAASPCALAVATPVTVVAAIGAAARRGVLIKGGSVLEELGRVRAVALDKTGTLTHGRPSVTDVYATTAGGSSDDVLALAAAVETFSDHPLAGAIVRAAAERGLPLPAAAEGTAIPGVGVEALVDGRRISVVKPEALVGRGVVVDDMARAWELDREKLGQTVAAVLGGGRLAGMIALADTIRAESKALVAQLKAQGVKRVVMLTGDNAGTAAAIAREAGVDDYAAALMPEGKVEKIAALKERYGTVAMVGDGINDAPALATASVGIAMGTGGSDAAIAAADVALVADDLEKLQLAFRLGRQSSRLIRQNIIASLAIVVVLVVATFAADLSMFAAVIGHEGSEVLIILNGLRVARTAV